MSPIPHRSLISSTFYTLTFVYNTYWFIKRKDCAYEEHPPYFQSKIYINFPFFFSLFIVNVWGIWFRKWKFSTTKNKNSNMSMVWKDRTYCKLKFLFFKRPMDIQAMHVEFITESCLNYSIPQSNITKRNAKRVLHLKHASDRRLMANW